MGTSDARPATDAFPTGAVLVAIADNLFDRRIVAAGHRRSPGRTTASQTIQRSASRARAGGGGAPACPCTRHVHRLQHRPRAAAAPDLPRVSPPGAGERASLKLRSTPTVLTGTYGDAARPPQPTSRITAFAAQPALFCQRSDDWPVHNAERCQAANRSSSQNNGARPRKDRAIVPLNRWPQSVSYSQVARSSTGPCGNDNRNSGKRRGAARRVHRRSRQNG